MLESHRKRHVSLMPTALIPMRSIGHQQAPWATLSLLRGP